MVGDGPLLEGSLVSIARLTVTVDGPSSRLLALSRAVAAQGSLPTESTKRLSGLVRSIRLYAEAYEPALALDALDEVEAFATDLQEAEPEHRLPGALRRHSTTLRSALKGM